MDRYEVYLHIGLLDAVPKSGVQRKLIMDFIYSLRTRPQTKGDYVDRDASLRIRQIKIIGDYAITYWLDDPVKSVMIVDIHPADR
jgi:mRNA-degrading endonuclease RelE of RelBE toxin-antitoxin system